MALAAILHAGLHAQSISQVVVAARGGSLRPEDISVKYDGNEVEVASVKKLGDSDGAPLELAILIDEAVRVYLDRYPDELEGFIRSIIFPRVAVGIGYMQRDGGISFPEGFSTNYDLVRTALQRPRALAFSADPMPPAFYLATHWPMHLGAARVVLLFSEWTDVGGIGSTVVDAQRKKAEDQVLAAFQRASIPLYSICFDSTLTMTKSLDIFGEKTGGTNLNGIMSYPMSIATYLQELRMTLNNSYLITFPNADAQLRKLNITSKVSGVKLRYQNEAQQLPSKK